MRHALEQATGQSPHPTGQLEFEQRGLQRRRGQAGAGLQGVEADRVVAQRGQQGGVFGILISLGIYFGYDWSRMIVKGNVESPWLVFFVPAGVVLLLVRRGGSREHLGALALCCGLGNTAFVGLPLIEALAGKGIFEMAGFTTGNGLGFEF